MFGLSKRERYTKAASDAIVGILTPLSMETTPYGELPRVIFEDAYVIGFLQVLSFAIIEELKDPGEKIPTRLHRRVFIEAIRSISPKSAATLPGLLAAYEDETSRTHSYLALGKLEGKGYTDAILIGDDAHIQHYLESFHDIIRGSYLTNITPLFAEELPATSF